MRPEKGWSLAEQQRPLAALAELDSLFHLAEIEDFEHVLERGVKIAVEAIDGADRGGIMVNDKERHLIGNTDDVATRLQQVEKEVGDGPCYDALHIGEPIWTEDIHKDERFPAFSACSSSRLYVRRA